ncbi:hypothetical protein chiPu_0011290 [Chiloscyllium punctatum]|uniref:Uncharacterized protein n=1 Tax=Chiloscyllium punctatum TaxID=137246 RepID=A0A401SR29_CHIPU|nr:hypothetical protein [Chiloscyllium punctatum]
MEKSSRTAVLTAEPDSYQQHLFRGLVGEKRQLRNPNFYSAAKLKSGFVYTSDQEINLHPLEIPDIPSGLVPQGENCSFTLGNWYKP